MRLCGSEKSETMAAPIRHGWEASKTRLEEAAEVSSGAAEVVVGRCSYHSASCTLKNGLSSHTGETACSVRPKELLLTAENLKGMTHEEDVFHRNYASVGG